MENLTITITKALDEEGYFYDIYLCEAEDIADGRDSEDGGMCKSDNITDALGMATLQARQLIKNLNNK